MSSRSLNWAGHSIQTIAAMYEADAAAREAMSDSSASAQQYWQSAWRAECLERELDEAQVS